jgi:hypothetical protein
MKRRFFGYIVNNIKNIFYISPRRGTFWLLYVFPFPFIQLILHIIYKKALATYNILYLVNLLFYIICSISENKGFAPHTWFLLLTPLSLALSRANSCAWHSPPPPHLSLSIYIYAGRAHSCAWHGSSSSSPLTSPPPPLPVRFIYICTHTHTHTHTHTCMYIDRYIYRYICSQKSACSKVCMSQHAQKYV